MSDEERSFAAPYQMLTDVSALQRKHELREMFNALRRIARAGASWRMLPNGSALGDGVSADPALVAGRLL